MTGNKGKNAIIKVLAKVKCPRKYLPDQNIDI